MRKRANPLDWFSHSKESGHYLYRVVVRDREGKEREGLARVGKPYWFCVSAKGCPVEVFWGAGREPLQVINKAVDRLAEGLGGSALGELVTARRLVVGFAVADLALGCLVLVFEGMMLAGVAIGVDRLYRQSASPQDRQEDLFGLAMTLGMFALYLPALVTLFAGGYGLIRRKRWGYSCHLAGAVFVAVSMFGIVYTIPALLVAIRPGFKDFCLGKPGGKQSGELIEDLL